MPRNLGKSAQELVASYRLGTADPVDATREVLAAVAAFPDQSIFIGLTTARALREAEASAARYRSGTSLGPLDGVPVGWKDLIDIAGTVTTAGSETRRTATPAEQDAPLVRRLHEAGMICIGKLNMSEFAHNALGVNPHFGTPRNPADPVLHRCPGGSSSGAAVAVASGLLPVAIGSDTGGSIRIPAALTGVVGYKSSEDRYDKTAVFPLSRTLDTIGPLCRTVDDCALVDYALRGVVAETPGSAQTAQTALPDLLVPTNVVTDGAEPAVIAAFKAALARLEEAGVRITSEPVPELDAVVAQIRDHRTLTAAEAYHLHRELLESERAALVHEPVVRRMMDGKSMTAYDVIEIEQGRQALAARLSQRLGQRMLVCPTVRCVAPVVADVTTSTELFIQTNVALAANTIIGNILGLCGLSIPLAVGRNALPVGFMIQAPAGHDRRLLAAGGALQPLLAAPDPAPQRQTKQRG